MRPTPLPQKLPIAPIFIAKKISLAVSHEKDGKLPFVYTGWGRCEGRRAERGLGASGKSGRLTPRRDLIQVHPVVL